MDGSYEGREVLHRSRHRTASGEEGRKTTQVGRQERNVEGTAFGEDSKGDWNRFNQLLEIFSFMIFKKCFSLSYTYFFIRNSGDYLTALKVVLREKSLNRACFLEDVQNGPDWSRGVQIQNAGLQPWQRRQGSHQGQQHPNWGDSTNHWACRRVHDNGGAYRDLSPVENRKLNYASHIYAHNLDGYVSRWKIEKCQYRIKIRNENFNFEWPKIWKIVLNQMLYEFASCFSRILREIIVRDFTIPVKNSLVLQAYEIP